MNDFGIAAGSRKTRRYSNLREPDTVLQPTDGEDEKLEPRALKESDLRVRLSYIIARELNSLLTSYSDFDDAIRRTLELLGTSLQMDRVYIVETSTDPKTGRLLMSRRFEWTSDRASAHLADPGLPDFPADIAKTRLAASLEADQVYKEVSSNFSSFEREFLDPQGVQSIIIAPIRIDGMLWGFIGFDDCHQQRSWTRNEEPILRMAAADISHVIRHRQAEEALKRSESLHRTFFETTTSIVLLFSQDARILAWNPAAEKLLGYAQEEVIGKSFLELFVRGKDREESRKIIRKVLEGEECRGVETEVLTRNGAVHTILWNARRLPEGNYHPHGVAAFGQDITERKRMESELLRAQKLEAVGILAGGIAHDFNNLVTAVLGNISLVKTTLNPADENFRRLTNAEQSCLQARELTNRLITFSDGGSPWRKITSLTSFLQKKLLLYPQSAKVLCRYRLPKDLYPVLIDEDQMTQVILHLFRNAEEAMPAGGEIVIEAENFTVTPDLAIDLEPGPYVRFSIRDQGEGIPREVQHRIFEPYYTSKPRGSEKGSGLGLAICYSIVRKHDGAITFSSEPGKGTTFTVYLPACVENEDAETGGTPSLQPRKERILLMDDEEAVRNITGQILTHLGYDVELVADGDEALDRFRQAKSAGNRFSWVMLDLTIRGGIGGFKILQRLREIDPEIRAVIVSGYTNDPVVEFFDLHGFNASLTKPFTIKQLQAALAHSEI